MVADQSPATSHQPPSQDPNGKAHITVRDLTMAYGTFVLMRDLTGTNGGAVGARNLVSDVVLQNVRVLGINLNANPTENKPAPPTNATLEVSVKDAQKLAVAASLGEISLALRGAGAAEVERVRTLRGGEVAPGAPRGASRARPGARAAPAQPTLIRIVEGDGDSKSGV